VATKRKKKRRYLKTLLLFIFTPIIVWFFAFLVWFYWGDIGLRLKKEPMQPLPKRSGQSEPLVKKPAAERIPEEDRKKLDEILNQRR
jgi:hypothetical protein